jgi:hypothetical protein
MKSKDLERKLKIERVEVCLNCILFTDCDDIGRFVECVDFLEVESDKVRVIVRLDDLASS